MFQKVRAKERGFWVRVFVKTIYYIVIQVFICHKKQNIVFKILK